VQSLLFTPSNLKIAYGQTNLFQVVVTIKWEMRDIFASMGIIFERAFNVQRDKLKPCLVGSMIFPIILCHMSTKS
jgi:hypothetical protein